MTVMSFDNTAINWTEVIDYPPSGIKSRILFEDNNCRYILMALSLEKAIAEHINPRNATVNVIEGQGLLTLAGKEISLKAGVFVFIPAHTPHAIQSTTGLAFLLTLSEQSPQVSSKYSESLEKEIASFTVSAK